MAYQRYYGYQYETSPRKIQPEYEPKRTKQQKKKVSTAKKVKTNNKKVKPMVKTKMDSKAKLVLYIAVSFVILFGIGYRNSLITEKFNKKEQLKTQLGSIQKENDQLKVNIEKSLNLNTVEQLAKEKLGMQKLDNKQKIYVNLPKKDYIEAASEEVVIKEETNIWDNIADGLKSLVNN